jgi:hypothetical protein
MTRPPKAILVALAVMALAAVPCAWDSRDIHDASWLPAIVSMLTGHTDQDR